MKRIRSEDGAQVHAKPSGPDPFARLGVNLTRIICYYLDFSSMYHFTQSTAFANALSDARVFRATFCRLGTHIESLRELIRGYLKPVLEGPVNLNDLSFPNLLNCHRPAILEDLCQWLPHFYHEIERDFVDSWLSWYGKTNLLRVCLGKRTPPSTALEASLYSGVDECAGFVRQYWSRILTENFKSMLKSAVSRGSLTAVQAVMKHASPANAHYSDTEFLKRALSQYFASRKSEPTSGHLTIMLHHIESIAECTEYHKELPGILTRLVEQKGTLADKALAAKHNLYAVSHQDVLDALSAPAVVESLSVSWSVLMAFRGPIDVPIFERLILISGACTDRVLRYLIFKYLSHGMPGIPDFHSGMTIIEKFVSIDAAVVSDLLTKLVNGLFKKMPLHLCPRALKARYGFLQFIESECTQDPAIIQLCLDYRARISDRIEETRNTLMQKYASVPTSIDMLRRIILYELPEAFFLQKMATFEGREASRSFLSLAKIFPYSDDAFRRFCEHMLAQKFNPAYNIYQLVQQSQILGETDCLCKTLSVWSSFCDEVLAINKPILTQAMMERGLMHPSHMFKLIKQTQ